MLCDLLEAVVVVVAVAVAAAVVQRCRGSGGGGSSGSSEAAGCAASWQLSAAGGGSGGGSSSAAPAGNAAQQVGLALPQWQQVGVAAMQVWRCSSVVAVTATEKLWLLRGVVPKEQVEVLGKNSGIKTT